MVHANPAALSLLEATQPTPFDASTWYELFSPWSRDAYLHMLLPQARRTGHASDLLSLVQGERMFFVVASLAAVPGEDSHACSLRATGRERKSAKSETGGFRSVVDGLGRFLQTDPVTASMLGVDEHELADRTVAELFIDSDRPTTARLLGEGAAAWVQRGMLHLRADPARTVHVAAARIRAGTAAQARFALVVEPPPAESAEQGPLTRQVATASLGQLALASPDPSVLFGELVELISAELDVPFANLTQLDPGGETMTLRAASNVDPATLGTQLPNFWFGEVHTQPLVVEDIESATIPMHESFHNWGLGALVSVPVLSRSGTWGWLAAADIAPRPFSPDDVGWLQSLANMLAASLRRAEDEELLRYRALHDPLTGLPNRDVLRDELATSLDRSVPGDVAVLFCDLDDFKIVNDSLGHPTGDRLLAALARRLRKAAGETDVIVRFGGDEFVMVTRTGGASGARSAAERLLGTVTDPFVIDGREIFLRASVGIAVSTGPDDDPARLIRDADAAMYRAKKSGRSRIEVFDRPMRAEALAALDTEHALHRAITNGELLLHYQPVVRLVGGEIAGCEALVRWRRANGSMQAPASFIPIAEKTGLIVEIGEWVLEQACSQLESWRRSWGADTDFTMSVNVSARQLAQSSFVTRLENTLARTGARPNGLCLEITESALLDEADQAHTVLEAIRHLGVRVSIDDFGTGYSSLARLKDLPVDELKIDRSFVDGLGVDDWDSAIVDGILSLARVRDLRVVAEGVETPSQAALLIDAGCPFAQGFHFAHPASAESVSALLADRLSAAT